VWWIWAGAHLILVGTIIALVPNMQARRKKPPAGEGQARAPADETSESRAAVEAGGDWMKTDRKTFHRWAAGLLLASALLLMGASGDPTGQRLTALDTT